MTQNHAPSDGGNALDSEREGGAPDDAPASQHSDHETQPPASTHADGTHPSGTRASAENQPDIQLIWRTMLEELNVLLSRDEYDTWIKDTRAIAYEDGELIVAAPTSYAVDWLQHRMYNRISWALRDIMQRTVHITFVVQARSDVRHDYDELPLYGGLENEQVPVVSSAPRAATAEDAADGTARRSPLLQGDLHLPNTPAAGRASANGSPVEVHGHGFGSRGYGMGNGREILKLNPTYTFDSFVVGNHNRMAHAAAEAVASDPGLRFNPLFVYGGVGLGKTHLLHAIGNRAIQQGLSALYCSSEMFTNELIQAIRSQSTHAFREKYRQVDILLIDDIQFIVGKESTQEEFFHTFNELYAADRHIVLSSDRPPKALATLEERLRSRFEGGLQTDISRPDFETRVAILQSKASRMGLSVAQDVLLLVAERVDSNVRELEGALNQLSLAMGTHRSVLTYDDAQSMLDSLAPSLEPCAPERVVELVGGFYGFTVQDLTGKRRPKELSLARQVAMYLLREENGLTLPAIGALLGGRDHTTVRHGVKRIAEDLNNDRSLREGVMAIRERIYQPLLP